ncbi:hypothetical protein [Empedobacter tilapiae]|uniref:Uncharacterized protein n=1 Tax=Empedobacter tilapiae TaxID=2491114 RepID=A0A4Z1BG94_9FLAO|nr:hypothetical protein [Empedobacter tilapiae]TGN27994.1 hypothetical protein E4J94_07220 [Empedobacter tilapiae]
MKYLILLGLVLVFFLIYKRLNFRKNIEKKEIKEPNVSFINVKKSDCKEKVITEKNTPYDFLISSITKKDNTLELLVSIRNHTEKTIRINLLEAIYFSADLRQAFTADVTFYGELNMGTNDILLKNTILPNSHVIRNIYFFEHDFLVFDENDYVEIILEINQKKYKFKQTLLESNLDSIKFIQKS